MSETTFNPQDICKIIRECKKNGVVSLKLYGIDVSFKVEQTSQSTVSENLQGGGPSTGDYIPISPNQDDQNDDFDLASIDALDPVVAEKLMMGEIDIDDFQLRNETLETREPLSRGGII